VAWPITKSSGLYPPATAGFGRVTNPDPTALVDRLIIRLANPSSAFGANVFGIDNIDVAN
jgi:hypothetical protein